MSNHKDLLVEAAKYLAGFLGVKYIQDGSKGINHEELIGLKNGQVFHCDFYRNLGRTQLVWAKLNLNSIKMDKVDYDQLGWFLDINGDVVNRKSINPQAHFNMCEAALVDTYLYMKNNNIGSNS